MLHTDIHNVCVYVCMCVCLYVYSMYACSVPSIRSISALGCMHAFMHACMYAYMYVKMFLCV
jgi:hypothetical protein